MGYLILVLEGSAHHHGVQGEGIYAPLVRTHKTRCGLSNFASLANVGARMQSLQRAWGWAQGNAQWHVTEPLQGLPLHRREKEALWQLVHVPLRIFLCHPLRPLDSLHPGPQIRHEGEMLRQYFVSWGLHQGHVNLPLSSKRQRDPTAKK